MLKAPEGAQRTTAAIKASAVRIMLADMRSEQRAIGQHDADRLLAIVEFALDDAALVRLYDEIAGHARHIL